ncbi:MAG TPA: VanZ family protein [Bacteroidia bacterium]|nr:VanZ family protein [Bacteroidia bacterium]
MFLRYLYPSLLWATFIFLLTFTSGKEFPEVTLISFDKLIHVFLFTVQSYLLMRGFIRQSTVMPLRYSPVIFSLLASAFLGAVTELMQAYLLADRAGDIYDFISNCIGTGAGVVIFVLLYGRSDYAKR